MTTYSDKFGTIDITPEFQNDIKLRDAGPAHHLLTLNTLDLAADKTYNFPDVDDNADFVMTAGDQAINGIKIFSSTISGNITGNAETVTNGVYTIGNQTIGGQKIFSSIPQSAGLSTSWGTTSGINTGAYNATLGTAANASWLISGTSNGIFRGGIQLLDAGGSMRIYTSATTYLAITGNDLSGNDAVNITGNAATVTNGVYTTGDQSIGGIKTFTSRLDVNHAGDEMMRLIDTSTTGSPYLSFYQTTTRRAYIQFSDSSGDLVISNDQESASLAIGSTPTFNYPLTISRSNVQELLILNGDADDSPYIRFKQNGVSRGYVQYMNGGTIRLNNGSSNFDFGSSVVFGNKTLSLSGGSVQATASCRLGTTEITSAGTIELGKKGSGDRQAFIDFHTAGAPDSQDKNARIYKTPGALGEFRFENDGIIILAPSNQIDVRVGGGNTVHHALGTDGHKNYGPLGTTWDGVGGTGTANWIGFKWNGNVIARIDNVTSVTLQAASDYRLKTDVEDAYASVKDQMMQLKVKRFFFTDFDGEKYESDHKSIGMFAHEVQDVFPELVLGEKDGINEETGSPEYQSVNYPGLTNHLIIWGQEQQREIDALKQEIADLKQQLGI